MVLLLLLAHPEGHLAPHSCLSHDQLAAAASLAGEELLTFRSVAGSVQLSVANERPFERDI